jgi:2-acylglycerol O-acyltransferase 2
LVPKSTQRSHHRNPRFKASNSIDAAPNDTNSSIKPKEKNPLDSEENTVIFEKFQDRKNGENLISIKPNPEYEKEPSRDRKESTKEDGDRSLGIRFAPWNVPLHRRLQTLVVLFHTLCIALSVSAFFFLCAIPIFWPLLIPYLIYCMTSNASTSGILSHRSDLLRRLPVWSLFASYFPARLHRSQELPPTRKYIFGYHPHGIISHGAFAAFATEALGFSQLFPG